MRFDKTNVYPPYIAQIEAALKRCVTDYPILEQLIANVHVENLSGEFEDRFATCKLLNDIRYEIKLNSEAFSYSGIEIRLKITSDSIYESIQDIITHEVGHALQVFYLKKKVNKKIYKKSKYKGICSVNSEFYWKVYMIKILLYKRKNCSWIINYLGENAYIPDEFLPECFNNYYRLKDKIKLDINEQEIFEFVKAVVEDYKRYIPQSIN